MKDFLGNELEVGDNVVCVERDRKELMRAVVLIVSPKTVTVEYTRNAFPDRKVKETIKRFSDQVVKV